jgi:hypothetical protein
MKSIARKRGTILYFEMARRPSTDAVGSAVRSIAILIASTPTPMMMVGQSGFEQGKGAMPGGG